MGPAGSRGVDQKHRQAANSYQLLKINPEIWEKNGKLKVFTPDDWRADWITVETRTRESGKEDSPADDDIPF
jgi:hypothetical protein